MHKAIVYTFVILCPMFMPDSGRTGETEKDCLSQLLKPETEAALGVSKLNRGGDAIDFPNCCHRSSTTEARGVLEDWRREYNEERPHKSLGPETPKAFALA